ncbi:3204_t:CDS:2 [Funneliformis geosporum]|nr:3204_t:CDS:2 [Funneliformis geosporum]
MFSLFARFFRPTPAPHLSDIILSRSVSACGRRDLDVLQVRYEPVEDISNSLNIVYCSVTIPEQYVLPKVNHEVLTAKGFNVENLETKDDYGKTFVDKLHDVDNIL